MNNSLENTYIAKNYGTSSFDMAFVKPGSFLLTLVLAATVTAQTQRSAPATPSSRPDAGNPTRTAIDIERITEQQFKALPSTAIVRYEGQTMTKAAFVEHRNRESFERQKALEDKAKAAFETKKREFEQRQNAELAAKNARVQAAAENYERRLQQLYASPAHTALIQEAEGIIGRYPSASPAEQAKMKQRAQEIHAQLSKMEQDAPGH